MIVDELKPGRKPEAERKAEAASQDELRRSLATENLVELEAREAEERRKAEEKRKAEAKVKTVSVMVRAIVAGFNVGLRRVDEIFSYEGARVGDDSKPILPSWVEPLTDAEIAKLTEKEDTQYPADYRLSLGQSSSPPPPPEVKPTQLRNPADGVKTAGEAGIRTPRRDGEPRTLSEGAKEFDAGSNAGEGSLAKGARDSGADLA